MGLVFSVQFVIALRWFHFKMVYYYSDIFNFLTCVEKPLH